MTTGGWHWSHLRSPACCGSLAVRNGTRAYRAGVGKALAFDEIAPSAPCLSGWMKPCPYWKHLTVPVAVTSPSKAKLRPRSETWGLKAILKGRFVQSAMPIAQ